MNGENATKFTSIHVRVHSAFRCFKIGLPGCCRSKLGRRKIAHSKSICRNHRLDCFRLIRNYSKHIDRYPMSSASSLSSAVCTISIIQKLCVSHEAVLCWLWMSSCSMVKHFPQCIFLFAFFTSIFALHLVAAFVHNERHGFILYSNRFLQTLQKFFFTMLALPGIACSNTQ